MRTLSILCCFICLFAVSVAAAADRPNVVIVLVDDLGWMDLSCQGSDYYKTPRIDALAAEGIRFTDAYAACAVCSPTRAAVMTGRWPARLGVTDWIRARFQRGNVGEVSENPTKYVGGGKRKLLCPPNAYFMEHSEVTLAEILHDSGYATGFIGKWHLGDPNWYPTSQGFDINIAGCDIGQPPSYFDPYKHQRYGFDGQLQPRKAGEFLTHREGDEASEYIRTHVRENPDEPFFLHYCPYAVHTPIQAIEEVAEKYKRADKKPINAKYAALVESVDDAVGMIMDTLKETGQDKNTLVVFTSDNGGLKGPTDNTPLRSGKGYAYEGGIRVPAIFWWPEKIPAGVVSNLPMSSVDILPTVCELTESKLPDAEIDGVSLWSHLQDASNHTPERDFLIWHFPHYRHAPGPYSIIRDGDLKMIRWYEGPVELYNLKDDLGEQNNLVDTASEKVVELDAKLSAELKRIGAKMPRPVSAN